MNKKVLLSALLLLVLCGVAYALTLPTVGGESLAVIARLRPDGHLLTAWLLPFVSRTPAGSLKYLRVVNFLLLLLLAAAITGRSNRGRWTILFVLLVTSPLMIGILLDPLGFEDLVSLGLILVAAADLAGLRVIGKTARFFIALALSLQDPLLTPAAVLYGILTPAPAARAFIAVAGAGLGIALRAYAAQPTIPAWPPLPDPTAGPMTIVASAALFFVVAPLFLLALRQRLPTVAALAGVPLFRCALLALVCGCGGLMAASGDPSAYWCDAEACLLIGATGSALRLGAATNRELVTAAATVLTIQLLVLIESAASLPALEISHATSVAEQALNAAVATRGACVASDAAGRRHVLADGALLLLKPTTATVVGDAEACAALPRASSLTVLTDMTATDWGAGGIALMRAATNATGPGVLPVTKGVVSPHARAATPTGEGAFGNAIDTPTGIVGQFTVLSGFSYLFPCVPSGRRLTFAVAPADAHGAYAYRVSLVERSSLHVLAAGTVASTPRTDSIQPWQLRSVPLPQAHGCRRLLFDAPTEPGITGAWVMYAGATVR